MRAREAALKIAGVQNLACHFFAWTRLHGTCVGVDVGHCLGRPRWSKSSWPQGSAQSWPHASDQLKSEPKFGLSPCEQSHPQVRNRFKVQTQGHLLHSGHTICRSNMHVSMPRAARSRSKVENGMHNQNCPKVLPKSAPNPAIDQKWTA